MTIDTFKVKKWSSERAGSDSDRMNITQRFMLVLSLLSFALGLSGCGFAEGVYAEYVIDNIQVTYSNNQVVMYSSDTDHDTIKPFLGFAGTKITLYDDGTYAIYTNNEYDCGYFITSVSGTYVIEEERYVLTDANSASMTYNFVISSHSEIYFEKTDVVITHDNSPHFGEHANFVFYFAY